MTIIFSGLLLLFTFYALARIVEVYFVETLEIISQRLKLSADIAGATFMAVGSSAPELFVSLLAMFRVSEEQAIGAGTIVGSAIFNILVIIGASALFRRALLTWQPVMRDLLFYILSILVLLYTFIDGLITLSDAFLYVGLYAVYLLSFKFWKRWFPYTTRADIDREVIEYEDSQQTNIRRTPWRMSTVLDKLLSYLFFDLKKRPRFYFINFSLAVILIAGLSHVMVEAAVVVAHAFNVSEVVIGLTVLAAGTSVPDLLSSIVVAKKGEGDMAIANAVGSNIFDIAIGLGLPWVLIIVWRGETLPVVRENLFSSIILLFATVVALLFLLVAKRWEIGRYAGVLLIGAYIFYILTQIDLISTSLCLNLSGRWCFSL